MVSDTVIMYVEIDNDATEKLKLPEMSKPAEFNDDNVAKLPKEDGKILIEEIEQAREAEKQE